MCQLSRRHCVVTQGLVSTGSALDRSVWWPVDHVCSAKADAATSPFWRVKVSCEEDMAGFSSSLS